MRLLEACLLTMVAETLFFALWKDYRRWAFLALCLAVNMATNLTLNTLLLMLPWSPLIVYPLETAVVAVEYGVYAYALGRSRRLFLLTLGANALSYSLGGLLYGFV